MWGGLKLNIRISRRKTESNQDQLAASSSPLHRSIGLKNQPGETRGNILCRSPELELQLHDTWYFSAFSLFKDKFPFWPNEAESALVAKYWRKTGRVPCLNHSLDFSASKPPASSADDFSSLTPGTLQDAINTKDTQSEYPEAFASLLLSERWGRSAASSFNRRKYNKRPIIKIDVLMPVYSKVSMRVQLLPFLRPPLTLFPPDGRKALRKITVGGGGASARRRHNAAWRRA